MRTPPWLTRRGSGLAAVPRDVKVLAVIAFCVAVGFGVLIPVLPVFAKSFQVSNFWVGAVVSSFALMRLVTAPFCGRISGVLGLRTTLASGIFIVAASTAAAGFAPNFWWLLITRGAGGIGSAMFSVSAMTLVLASVPGNQRGRATSTFQSGFVIGFMAGPAIGGLVAAISTTAPFFFYAITLVVAGAVGLLMLRDPDADVDDSSTEPARPLREVLGDIRFRSAALANFSTGWNSMGVRTTLVPILVVESLHQPPSWTGIAFAVGAVVQTLALTPVGRAVDSIGRKPVIIGSSLLCGATFLAVPYAPNVWVLMALMGVYGIGTAGMASAPAAAVGDAAGARSGTPVALFSMVADLGAITGPLAAGIIADHFSLAYAFIGGAGIMALTALLATRMPAWHPVEDLGAAAVSDPEHKEN